MGSAVFEWKIREQRLLYSLARWAGLVDPSWARAANGPGEKCLGKNGSDFPRASGQS